MLLATQSDALFKRVGYKKGIEIIKSAGFDAIFPSYKNKEQIYEVARIAKEKDMVDTYSDILKQIAALVDENPDYTEFLSSPALPLSERLSAIDEAFGLYPEEIASFLKLLCENGHIKEIKECIEEFIDLENMLEKSVAADVYSSVELSDEQKEKLTQKLETKFGKKVLATFEVDKSLIGGIKIVMEDEVLDGSIEKRLKDLKEVIKQ